jgi:hypothetical protein
VHRKITANVGRRVQVIALGDALCLEYGAEGRALLVVVRLRGAGPLALRTWAPERRGWRAVLGTEAPGFAADPRPVSIDPSRTALALVFAGPGAVVLEAQPSAPERALTSIEPL